MPDNTLDLSQSLDTIQKLLKIIDNGDGTFSIATSVVSGAATLEVNLDNAADDVLVYGNDGTTNRAIKTDASGNVQVEDADALAELRAMNLLSSVVFDSILITYVDATKAVISKVEWKLGATVVKTLTPTFGATTDNWVKS